MIELTTSLIFLFSAFYGGGAEQASAHQGPVATPVQQAYAIETKVEGANQTYMPVATAGSMESKVRAYFANTPVLIKIAECESRFKQYDSNGNVVRGIVNPSDVGVMQINTYYHKATADKLGIDLMTPEGNMAYAKWLYDREGASPWVHSSQCWAKGEFANAIARN